MSQDFLELGVELGVEGCLKASNLVHRIRKLGINITQAVSTSCVMGQRCPIFR
jgi:hypothetical protein